MKVLSYNIRFGGRGREDRIAALIQSCQPDVVLLQEATDPVVFDRIRAATGMAHGASRAGYSLAFLSRVGVEHHAWYKPAGSRHAFLEIVVGGDLVRLFGLHLSAVHAAWTERQRVTEIRALLASIARHQHGFHVIAGDFNTLAPGEQLDVRRLPHRLRPFVWLSGGQIRWRTIHSVLEHGYVDGYKQHHPDRAGLTFPTWDPHVRLDYAFVPAAFAPRLRACDVVTMPSAIDTSDHFPLLFELDVKAPSDAGGGSGVVGEARARAEVK